MITSIYRGGLGNQLFEVAAGYVLAQKNGDTYAINPNLHAEYGQGNHIRAYLDTIFKKVPKTDHKGSVLYKEPQFAYTEIEYKPDLLLDGYFQSEKYLEGFRGELNELFGYDYEGLENARYGGPICTVHIRTGDYIHQPNFNVVTPRYFENAMNTVRHDCPDIRFLVISDDLEQAENYIPEGVKVEFLRGDEAHSLRLMSISDYCIISNSSFSWWGSFLGQKKVTLAPYKWFNVDFDTSDVYRDDMIKVPF